MIYLLFGADELARSEAVLELKARVPPDLVDFNVSVLDGRRLPLNDLVAACEAFPFIAERRLVIVNDLLKHSRAGKERDALRAYLEQVPPTCDLVLVESDAVDRRSSLYTTLTKLAKQGAAEVCEYAPLQGAELLRWLSDRATRLGARIDRTAAQQLIDYVGGESRALSNELAKLATYAGAGRTITSADVALLVHDGQEQNLFAFIDELSQRRRDAALHSLRRLLDDGQAPTYIVFMIARQVRILLSVKELAARRMRPDDIAAAIGQRPFVVRKALEQARGFTDDEIVAFHDQVLALDHAIKTGRVEPATGLEVLVVELCR